MTPPPRNSPPGQAPRRGGPPPDPPADPPPDPPAGPAPEPLHVRAGETGVIRLFALDMPPEQARFLKEEPDAAAQALGVAALDPAEIEIFSLRDLEGLGLAGYLAEGYGIGEDQLAPDRDRLATLTGQAMVIRSRAFGGRAADLRPAPGIRPVAVYLEPGVDWSGGRIETESARPGSAPPRPRRKPPRRARAEARMIGALIFSGVMTLVIALVAWLATR